MASDAGPFLHRLAWVALGGAFALVLAGGLVSAGDAFPAETGLPLALAVAAWTAFLLLAVLRCESNPLLRRLAFTAGALVLLQALLGGLRALPPAVNLPMVHGAVVQVFFASLAALVAVTSPTWEKVEASPASHRERVQGGILLATVVAQILLGLSIRHLGTEARPLAGTPLLYAHVAGAGLVLSALLDFQRDAGTRRQVPGGRLLLPLVWTQVSLGIAAYVTTDDGSFDRQAGHPGTWLAALHVGVGAALLGTVVVRNLHAWRDLLEHAAGPAPAGLERAL